MGRLNTFEIFLTNEYGQVQAGSLLQGQIVLECSDDIAVKEIIVHCFGKCRVQWVDTRAAAPLAEVQAGITPPVTAEESYINDFYTCFPKREEGQPYEPGPHVLSKGMHTFDFSFNIPLSAPPTFMAEHGFIKYIVRAQVHLSNKVENNVRYFTVRPVFDLNRVSNVEECSEKNGEVEVNSILRHWGKCRAKLSIPKRGYVHGDAIPVSVKITNDSNKELTKARLRLRMVTKYTIKTQSCTGDRILAESRLAPITPGYTFDSCDRCLQVPMDIPASHLHGCKFMHVKYYVELFIRPSLLSVKKLRMSIKIHIGTIPISLAREQAYLRMREAPPKYDELPPSYHDAIRLQLAQLQANTLPESNNQTAYESSSCQHLAEHPNDALYDDNYSNREFGATCSNDICSDSENIFSSRDSLISMEEYEDDYSNLCGNDGKFQRPFAHRPAHLPTRTCAEDLRIAVLRHNLARAREELPVITDPSGGDSDTRRNCAKSRKPLAAILNSFFTAFPFVCQDMKS